MVEQRLMSFEEKVRIGAQAARLAAAGKKEEAAELENTIPYSPFAAQFIKKYLGLNVLLSANLNLAEVEQTYGKEWLTH